MSEKDTKAKEFLADNKRFADLCNYVVFHGRQVIRPEDLMECDTTELLPDYGAGRKEKQVQKWRDLLKRAIVKSTKEAVYVLFGIENQSDIHYAMPVKNMIYDALNYGAQVTKAAKKHRAERDWGSSGEFLSGFHKEDRLTPVITITVYWGMEKWDAPRGLHEMLSTSDPDILAMVNDYRTGLVIPDEIEDFTKFTTSLGKVLEAVQAAKDKALLKRLVDNGSLLWELENDAVSAISVFTGIDIPIRQEEVTTNMCEAWEELKKEMREEGEVKGLAEGRINILTTFFSNGGTPEMARSMMGFTDDEIEKVTLQLGLHTC